jgi:3-oxoacyl-[acyl-carrier protein] reductase
LTAEVHARELAAAHGARALRVDVKDPVALAGVFDGLAASGTAADVLVHCAAVHRAASLAKTTCEDLDEACRVTGRAALVATQAFARHLVAEGRPGHVVLVGALDRTQSLPVTATFAAAQGMLPPLAMALAKELGASGIRVNVVTGGLVGEGVSRGLAPERVADYLRFSALRRLGTPVEVAAAVCFLALENEYMTGKVLAANGGL